MPDEYRRVWCDDEDANHETDPLSDEGIGGLLNSDAPWLRGFPEPQRSDILDVLFKPRWAASLQVLKLEIGGESPLMESRIRNVDSESCSDSSAVGSKFV